MTVLKRVQRLDSIKLDSTYFTDEGYFVDHPILTSVGIFEYLNADGSIRRELRLPEHVFSPNSLKTYKGKPIIITHDAGVVNSNNVDDEQVGTIMSAGYQDGDDVRAEIIIHNTDAMKQCGLKELSLGYSLDSIEEPGEWEGEPYDSIQTNIKINHLALVDSARAGEQARLNIDSSSGTTPPLKGGKAQMKRKRTKAATSRKSTGKRYDNNLSPEDVAAAIAAFIASKEGDSLDEPEEEVAMDAEEIVEAVKENKDRRDSDEGPADLEEALEVILQQDEDIDSLLGVIEQLKESEPAEGALDEEESENVDEGEEEAKNEDEDEEECETDGEEENESNSESGAGGINADSADKIIRERLAICRVGDKLNLDGLENKSLIAAKKAVIKKVFPDHRMDGKGNSYVQAMYDIAAEKAGKMKKDTNYQRAQMSSNRRMDSEEYGKSTAATARKKMIDRREEGGK